MVPFMRHLLPYKYIEEIAKAGSIRKAAETLAITPSALNRRLLSMEEELGTALFERLAVGVRLNTAGEILLKHIRSQMSDLERVKSQISDLSGHRRGHVSIAASPEMMGGFLAAQVRKYQTEFPGVTFSTNQYFRGDVEQSLVDLETDIGIVFEPFKLADFQTIFDLQQPTYCVMPASHPLAKHEQLRLYECAEFPLVLPSNDWGIRNILEKSALRLGLNLRTVIQSNDREFLSTYKREPYQLSFEIPLNLPNDLEARDQVAIPVNPIDVPDGFAFVGHLKGRTLPVAAARFLEALTTDLARDFG